eukprot:Hpha_TRINITY_DN33891_c0_g1::TRINITY_DN33891_c0_g1_i1::g.27456::m.27456
MILNGHSGTHTVPRPLRSWRKEADSLSPNTSPSSWAARFQITLPEVVYCVPYQAPYFLKYEFGTNTLSKLELNTGFLPYPSSAAFFGPGCVATDNGEVLAPPLAFEYGVRIDKAGTVHKIADTGGGVLNPSGDWAFLDAIAVGNAMYSFPYAASYMLKVDVTSDPPVLSKFSVPVASMTQTGKYYSIVRTGNFLIGVPCDAQEVAVFDITEVQPISEHVVQNLVASFPWGCFGLPCNLFHGAAVSSHGVVYAAPYDSDALLEVYQVT